MPEQAPRIRHWKQDVRWKKAHPERGMFGAVQAGQVETLRLPVFIHVCWVCDSANAPFGHNDRYYCREHDPVLGK